jgi:GNAT superfamily N-acetyltransferase
MTSSPHIEQIRMELARRIRHKAMYPDEKPEVVELPDDEEGIHFGLFDNNQLISVVSWFRRSEREAQFRKFGTLEQFRNQGYGARLMSYIIDFSKMEGIEILWCNARIDALSLYKRLGFKETETTFNKGGIDYIIIQLELH